MNRNHRLDFWLVLTISLVFGLVILSFKNFFFFNPLDTRPVWLGALQVISMFGWISMLAIVPIVVLRMREKKYFRLLLRVACLLWPGVLVLIHVSLFFTTGNPYLSYLLENPIFIFTDIAAPVIYLSVFKQAKIQ